MIKKNMLKKLLASILLAIYLLATLSVPYARAQGSWYDPSFQEWNDKVFKSSDDEIFGERYTYAQVKWIFYSLTAIVTGTNSETVSCLMSNDINECLDVLKQELSSREIQIERFQNSTANSVFGEMSRPPISGIFYLKNIGQKLKLIPEAQAQAGFGFGSLNPVLNLWKASRDITFALFVLIILVLAFMIMFRVKISPQTVITAQSALPKVAIALVLVTFSYAIAGLAIDLMYVVIGLITTVLISTDFLADSTKWADLFNFLTNGPLNSGAFGLMSIYFSLFPVALIASLFQALGSSVMGILTFGLGLVLLPIILVVISIVLLVAVLKLLWLLLVTFANIVLLIVVAPFMIAIGAITPGGGFGTWLRSLVSHLAVYPIVGGMFTLSYIFLVGSIYSIFSSSGGAVKEIFDLIVSIQHKFSPIDFNPELLGSKMWSPPLTVGTGMSSLLWLGLSLVLVIMTPQVANMIKALIQGKPFAFGTAIGEAFAPMKYPAAYALEGLHYGELPPIYPAALRRRAEGWLQASDRGMRGLLKGFARTGARTLSEGNLPRPRKVRE